MIILSTENNIQFLSQLWWRINEINKDLARYQQRVEMDTAILRYPLKQLPFKHLKSYRKVVDTLIQEEASADSLVKHIHGRTINRRGKCIIRDFRDGRISQNNSFYYTNIQILDLCQLQKQDTSNSMIEMCQEL